MEQPSTITNCEVVCCCIGYLAMSDNSDNNAYAQLQRWVTWERALVEKEACVSHKLYRRIAPINYSDMLR